MNTTDHATTTSGAAVAAPVERTVRPRAWLCELMMEDGTTRTQFVEEDPDGLRWNDAGEPSPYRVTPLYDLTAAPRLISAEADFEAMTWTFDLPSGTPVGAGQYAVVWMGPNVRANPGGR